MKHAFRALPIAILVLAASRLPGQQFETDINGAPALPNGPSSAISTGQISTNQISTNQGTGVPGPGHSSSSSYRRDDTPCVLDEPCESRLSFNGKLRYFENHSFGPGAFFSPLFTAGPEMANPPAHYPKEWRQGAAAFGRLYGDALAFQTAAQTGRFLTGAALHEDPRYLRSSSSNPLMRTMHAIVFTAFDKSDSGHTTFALSNFAGAASAGFVGNAYLPRGYNDTSHALTRTGIAFGSFAFTNLAIEFSPELRRMGRALHLPKFMFGQAEK